MVDTSKVDEMYHEFKIWKNRRKGKFRLIQAPNDELKYEQRRLLWILERGLSSHKCAYGFVEGRSIFDNARIHENSECIFTLDIKNFFDTITQEQVLNMLSRYQNRNGWSNSDIEYVARVCSRYGHLVQGAPTSPLLSNMVMKPVDKKIYTLCRENDLIYTRYADDITISGRFIDINRIKRVVFSIVNKAGFKISYGKVQTLGKHRQQSVTGVVVNEKLSISRRKVKRIRAILHNIIRDINEGKLLSEIDIAREYLAMDKLQGYVSFMNQCDKRYSKYLRQVEEIYKLLEAKSCYKKDSVSPDTH